jgi:predicted Zn-dependent protease
MKAAALILAAVFVMGTATPARAQLGGFGKLKKLGDKVVDSKQKYDDMNITDAEERQLGDLVGLKLREHFGVYQNEAVTKYVSLVGTTLALGSTRPNLDWTFIVLDTDGVNAYAAPGGIVHVTRGLLGLMKSEAELAGVLGHEITHVTAKHTVRSIQTGKASLASNEISAGGDLRRRFITKLVDIAFKKVYEGEFSQQDENESDKVGVRLANQAGYAPNGMVEVLKKIDARNGSREERNGIFASHPSIKERTAKIEKQIIDEKLAGKAIADARYKETITFEAKPIAEIAMDVEGAAGLASGDKKKEDDKKADEKKDEPRKKGFGLGSITGSKQTQASQQTASAGARGGVPDRDAKGGPNKNPLGVKITAAELEAFKKGIRA